MKDKYDLSHRENIFLAKKTLVENIYYTAKMEGVNVTFPQTQTILAGVSVGNLDIHDIQKILNLRNAWRYTLRNIESSFNLDYIKKIHTFVAYNESMELGVLRKGNSEISEVEYKPATPVESEVICEISDILDIPCVTKRALTYMLWAMRRQLFSVGNKRTSIISANKLLIENGKGMVSIEEKNVVEFNEKLSRFYKTNDYSHMIDFLYDTCVFGIDYT